MTMAELIEQYGPGYYYLEVRPEYRLFIYQAYGEVGKLDVWTYSANIENIQTKLIGVALNFDEKPNVYDMTMDPDESGGASVDQFDKRWTIVTAKFVGPIKDMKRFGPFNSINDLKSSLVESGLPSEVIIDEWTRKQLDS